MSIEKYNPKMEYEIIPFAQININVIQNITDMDAGFVWVYLQTKPKDWKIIKEHIKNHFKIGNAKIKKIFSYLAKHNLIEYIQENDEQGKFGQHDIRVLNGSKFKTYPQIDAGGSENRPAVNRSTGFGLLHIKENTKEIKSREQAREKRVPLPDDFILDERAIKRCKAKGINENEFLEKFKLKNKSSGKLSADWQALAMSWIITENPANPASAKSEMKSTIKEYGPGHPTWEAMNKWNKQNKGASHGSDNAGNNVGRDNLHTN